jgi:hypothetical protein
MSELITLNPTEQFLQNSGMTMTLKDIADKYGKRHNDLMDTFKLAVSKLTDENISYVAVVPVNLEITKGNGAKEIISSFELDLRTTLWLMTKFDENLRMNVINFAFEKLEESKRLAVKQAKLPKVYKDGNMSVRGCITSAWDDEEEAPMERDVWNAMVWKGFVITKAKATIQRKIPENLDGFIGSTKGDRGFATFKPHIVREVWEEFEKAGKPIKSEYERLKEEFAEISKYYEEKIAEAKGK